MNLHQFLLILLARYKVALCTMIGTVIIGMVASSLLPKQYTATAAVLLDVRAPDPLAGIVLPFMPGLLSTQVEIIGSDRVAQKVVKMLRLNENPAVKAQWEESTQGQGNLEVWLAALLQRGLTVRPSRESYVIRISFRSADPQFAAAVAGAFARAYIDTTIELKVEPARQYARWFEEQGKSLRENVEKAQSRLSAFQQDKGIVARDEQLDSETAKLTQFTAQLTAVQGQATDALSKQRSGKAADTLPEVTQNPLITGLKTDINRQEAKLQEVALNLGRNHPQYQRMESEIAALKQRLQQETRHVTSGFSTLRTVSKSTESELLAAIAEQKQKLLKIKSERDQLAVLQRDLDAVQRVYDTVTQRFNQTSLESQATQTNASVFDPADVPVEPSFPKPLPIMLLLSIGLGALLGVAAAAILEMLDRRIRSVGDLAEMLQLPVLGVLERPQARRRLLLPFRRRPALGAK
jgi:chain length determinant protein EpsF